MDIFFIDQPFDNRGARCGCAKPFGAHSCPQFFVVDQFARPFHGGEQRRFGKARRRFRFIGRHVDLAGLDRFVLFDRHDRWRVFGLDIAAIYRHPAGVHHHFAFTLEWLAFHSCDARRHQEFRCRIENCQEALCHQVIKLRFGLAQILALLKMRLFSFTQSSSKIFCANPPYCVCPSASSVAFTVPI